jgi:3-oxoadipate enol-lactonase
MTGLGVAIEHPSRIARLICCGARSDAPPPFVDNWTARIASVESAGNLEPVAAFNKGRWFTPAFIASHPYVVDKVMKMILATSTRGYIGCACALLKLDYKRHLGRIECPTLLVCGAQDGATPPAVMREMTGLVGGAAIELVDPGAHICNIENQRASIRSLASGCRAERAERLFLERPPASDRSRTNDESL